MCGYNVGMLECVDTMLECVDMWILFSGLISFDRSDLNCCADENTQKNQKKIRGKSSENGGIGRAHHRAAL